MVSQGSKTSSPGSEDGDLERGDESRMKRSRSAERKAAKSRPLDETTLRDLALSYVARFATTGAKLETYLARKLRERGVAEDEDGRTRELDVTGVVTRMIELGYVDDDAFARAKSRDLTARGYGKRRVEQALWAAGVEEEVRDGNAPGEAESRRAAILLAKKRGFGPYGRGGIPETGEDAEEETQETLLARQKEREKQVAAMLRAGHDYEHVRFILDASDIDEIDNWLSEAEQDEASEEGSSW